MNNTRELMEMLEILKMIENCKTLRQPTSDQKTIAWQMAFWQLR